MNRRNVNRFTQLMASLGLMVALVLVSAIPAAAAPLAQDVDDEDTVFDTPLVRDIDPEMRGAFVMMAQAERAVTSALEIVDPFDVLGTLGAAGDLGEGDLEILEDEEAIQEFHILQPSTIVTLRTTWEVLGSLADGLDDFELLLEADVAEELVLSQDILGDVQVEEGDIVETQEEADTDIASIQNILDEVDVDVEIANGECGDLDTLVRVARRDIARALGATATLGGEFDIETQIDPDQRLFALAALDSHAEQIQDAVSCLAAFAQ